jgi:hypothetical protein
MTDDDSVSCPQRRGIENRRKELAKWHRSKEWFAFRDLHARTPDAVCVHCGKKHNEIRVDVDGNIKRYKSGKRKGEPIRVNLTVNHLSRRKYISLEEYTTWDDDCEVCCDLCNQLYEQGKVICPVCKKRYIDSNSNDKECDHCYYEKHPDELAKKIENIENRNERNRIFKKDRATKRRIRMKKHKCKFNGAGGKCRYRPGRICTHAATKAEKTCEDFQIKKCKVKK